MNRIRKAVIPAAGLGTRFLPATKAMPKEMLPIVDKPTIQYIVEEAVASGVEDIIIVTGKGKRAIEDHFDRSVELEELLLSRKKYDLLDQARDIANLANIHYIRQSEPLGLGHAVWCARRFIGDEPFAVLLGDDIVRSKTPCLRQLMDVYDQYGMSTVAVQNVPLSQVHRYGVVDPLSLNGQVSRVRGLVEKPVMEKAPSTLAITGRYVLTPTIFEFLSRRKIGDGGEIQLTDALSELNQREGIMAFAFDGRRYDVGEKFGFIEATLELALRTPELRADVNQLLRRLVDQAEVTAGRWVD